MKMRLLLAAIFLISSSPIVDASLSDKLHSHTIGRISKRTLIKREKRSTDPSHYNRIEEFDLVTDDQTHLRLVVSPSRDALHPSLRVVGENDMAGTSTDYTHSLMATHFDRELEGDPLPMHGHVHGARDSHVRVSIDEHGALDGVVHVDNRTLVLEPLVRHVHDADPRDTLVYHVQDVKMSEGELLSKCSSVDLNEGLTSTTTDGSEHVRRKRDEDEEDNAKTRCSIKLFADYSFYEHIAQNDIAKAARYLISLIDRVNVIYTSTAFTGDGRRWGFAVKEIRVKQSWTPNAPNHWNSLTNAQGRPWLVTDLLQAFTVAEGTRPSDSCLVHMFTYRSFGNGVLGLGYIASPRPGTQGGMCCTPTSMPDGSRVYHNSALSTLISSRGDPVVTREADVVTAHELGHNWCDNEGDSMSRRGSTHDEPTEECSPADRRGGAFIMNTFSVSGDQNNNDKFSPCSKRSIGRVLMAKAPFCFEHEMATFCGNGRVEVGEECDVGLQADGDTDRCCTATCQLRRGMACSKYNSVCCTDACQFAPRTHECQARNDYECHTASTCDGRSGECPPSASVADRTPCIGQGQCFGGTCLPFCEVHNKLSCVCKTPEESCYQCCRDSVTSDCRAVASARQLDKGARCHDGVCDELGVCVKESADYVEHLWKIFENLDGGSFWTFVDSNIVFVVIVVSLFIWIPSSLLVHFVDAERAAEKRRVQQEEELRLYRRPVIDAVRNLTALRTRVDT